MLLVSIKVEAQDSVRIVDFPTQFHAFLKVNSSNNEIEISNPNINDELNYRPNLGTNIQLGFSYSWLGLAYSIMLPADNSMNQKYGKTSGFVLEGHFMKPRIMIDVAYKRFKGFYLANPSSFITGWNNNIAYPHSADLGTSMLSFNCFYVFRPQRYSPTAAYAFTKAMRKRGGSWMLGCFGAKSAVFSDTSIVSHSLHQYVNPELNLKEMVFYEFGLSFGYSYLVTILKKNFVSFTLMPGVSVQSISQKSAIDNSINKRNAISQKTVMRFSMGRNGNNNYYGIVANGETSVVKNSSTELSFISNYVEVFYGHRFSTVNWKFMKKVDKILHPKRLSFITGNPPARD